MNRLTRAALAGLAVAITGPVGLIAIAVFYLRKNNEQQQKQVALLTQSTLTNEQK